MRRKKRMTMRPLELEVERYIYGGDFSEGKFSVDGMAFGESMEPCSRHLSADMPLKQIKALKVPGKTAIPCGRYRVIWALSSRLKDRAYAKPYGGKFPLLCDVPGWSGVLIHPFNYGRESQGCIGVGERWKDGVIIRATQGYKDFMDYYFVPAMERGQEVYITIKEK